MHLTWPILKKTVMYYWDELLYLSIFNFVIFVGVVPLAELILTSLPETPVLILAPFMLLLFLIAPYLIFSLFWTVYDIGEGKAIKLGTFFGAGKEVWRQAYLWAAVNVVAYVLLISNIHFYSTIEAGWAASLSFFFIGLTVMWSIIQLYALALYPRLVRPSLKEALKNGLALVGSYPLLTLFMAILSFGFLIAVVIPLISAVLSFCAIAMLVNATTEAVIKDIRRKRGDDEETDKKKVSEIQEWRLDDER